MNGKRTTFKFIEFVSCVAAIIIKKLSDSQADRIYRINEKFSREWRLLNNLTWSQEGHDFSIFLFVGFTFITGVFLVSSWFDDKMRLSEKLMCIFGVIFYALEGCLVLASLEYIPTELSAYAYILGGVSHFTAALLIIDLCIFGGSVVTDVKSSQTDAYYATEAFGKIDCVSRTPYRIPSINGFRAKEDLRGNSFLDIHNKSPPKASTKALKKYPITAV